MTEPTRDALHEETLAWLVQGQKTINTLAQGAGTMYGAEQHARETRVIAYAAECVKRVPELEAEVAALRAENARLASAGRRILGAWDALDAIPPDDPRPTHEFAGAFAATLEPMRDALSAARPIDPQRGPTDE